MVLIVKVYWGPIDRNIFCLIGLSSCWSLIEKMRVDFPPRMWSCLAGFIEEKMQLYSAGLSSLEEAVRREAYEETSIEVGQVVYHSGPNSLPCQLMVGFFAYAKSLEDAQWHSREDVRKALAFAEYKKAQRTAAAKVDQICKGVKKRQRQSSSADDIAKSGEPAPMFVPGPFAIAHHLISAWANQDPPTGVEAQLKPCGGFIRLRISIDRDSDLMGTVRSYVQ
ncbi:hypothetical protein GQ457_10G016540 [Hibiscus cannabinus]